MADRSDELGFGLFALGLRYELSGACCARHRGMPQFGNGGDKIGQPVAGSPAIFITPGPSAHNNYPGSFSATSMGARPSISARRVIPATSGWAMATRSRRRAIRTFPFAEANVTDSLKPAARSPTPVPGLKFELAAVST